MNNVFECLTKLCIKSYIYNIYNVITRVLAKTIVYVILFYTLFFVFCFVLVFNNNNNNKLDYTRTMLLFFVLNNTKQVKVHMNFIVLVMKLNHQHVIPLIGDSLNMNSLIILIYYLQNQLFKLQRKGFIMVLNVEILINYQRMYVIYQLRLNSLSN